MVGFVQNVQNQRTALLDVLQLPSIGHGFADVQNQNQMCGIAIHRLRGAQTHSIRGGRCVRTAGARQTQKLGIHGDLSLSY